MSYTYTATPPPLDIRKGGKRLSVKHHPLEGNLKRVDTSQENLPGWLLFVEKNLRLNVLKIHSTDSCIFSP